MIPVCFLFRLVILFNHVERLSGFKRMIMFRYQSVFVFSLVIVLFSVWLSYFLVRKIARFLENVSFYALIPVSFVLQVTSVFQQLTGLYTNEIIEQDYTYCSFHIRLSHDFL